PSYFRVRIIDGECSPYYTEVIEVLEATPQAPVVTTKSPSSVAARSAVTGGTVTNTGGLAVTDRGVVYGTSPNPDVDNDIVVHTGTGGGTFSSLLTGLTPNTKYYYRAFATNSLGTSYGEEQIFTTLADKVYYIGEE